MLVDKYGMEPVVTYTTRPMRPGEVDGETYHFISEEEFIFRLHEGFFAESAWYDVDNGERWYYGSSLQDYFDGDNKVIILNPHGLKSVLNKNDVEVVACYIRANENTIWERGRERGDDLNECARRIAADATDFNDIYDHIDTFIWNDSKNKINEVAYIVYELYRTIREVKYAK